MSEVPGSEFEIKADLVTLAMGFVIPVKEGMLEQAFLSMDIGVKLPGKLVGEEISNNFKESEGTDAMLAERVKQWTQEWKREGHWGLDHRFGQDGLKASRSYWHRGSASAPCLDGSTGCLDSGGGAAKTWWRGRASPPGRVGVWPKR